MEKLGIVIDSFSGISRDEVVKEGFYYLPLQIDLDGKTFLDGVDYSTKDSILLVKNSKSAKTSLPPINLIDDVIKEVLEKYENVIFIPLSPALSGTYNLLKIKTEKYSNVNVIDNHLSGDLYFEVAKKIKKMSDEGSNIDEILKWINDFNDKSLIYIVPKSLDAFIKSGRLTGAKKYLMTTLNVIPIIKFWDKVRVSGVKRSLRSAIEKTVEKLIKFINGDENIKNNNFKIVHTGDPETLEIAKNVFANKNITLTSIILAGTGVMVHTGWGSIGISVSPKIE